MSDPFLASEASSSSAPAPLSAREAQLKRELEHERRITTELKVRLQAAATAKKNAANGSDSNGKPNTTKTESASASAKESAEMKERLKAMQQELQALKQSTAEATAARDAALQQRDQQQGMLESVVLAACEREECLRQMRRHALNQVAAEKLKADNLERVLATNGGGDARAPSSATAAVGNAASSPPPSLPHNATASSSSLSPQPPPPSVVVGVPVEALREWIDEMRSAFGSIERLVEGSNGSGTAAGQPTLRRVGRPARTAASSAAAPLSSSHQHQKQEEELAHLPAAGVAATSSQASTATTPAVPVASSATFAQPPNVASSLPVQVAPPVKRTRGRPASDAGNNSVAPQQRPLKQSRVEVAVTTHKSEEERKRLDLQTAALLSKHKQGHQQQAAILQLHPDHPLDDFFALRASTMKASMDAVARDPFGTAAPSSQVLESKLARQLQRHFEAHIELGVEGILNVAEDTTEMPSTREAWWGRALAVVATRYVISKSSSTRSAPTGESDPLLLGVASLSLSDLRDQMLFLIRQFPEASAEWFLCCCAALTRLVCATSSDNEDPHTEETITNVVRVVHWLRKHTAPPSATDARTESAATLNSSDQVLTFLRYHLAEEGLAIAVYIVVQSLIREYRKRSIAGEERSVIAVLRRGFYLLEQLVSVQLEDHRTAPDVDDEIAQWSRNRFEGASQLRYGPLSLTLHAVLVDMATSVASVRDAVHPQWLSLSHALGWSTRPTVATAEVVSLCVQSAIAIGPKRVEKSAFYNAEDEDDESTIEWEQIYRCRHDAVLGLRLLVLHVGPTVVDAAAEKWRSNSNKHGVAGKLPDTQFALLTSLVRIDMGSITTPEDDDAWALLDQFLRELLTLRRQNGHTQKGAAVVKRILDYGMSTGGTVYNNLLVTSLAMVCTPAKVVSGSAAQSHKILHWLPVKSVEDARGAVLEGILESLF